MSSGLLRRIIPGRVAAALRGVGHLVGDAWDLALGRRDLMTPPRRLMFDGPQDYKVFRENGEEFLRLYRELAGLKPDELMLDVGSGIGRKTIPLTRYLGPAGRYEGFDISRVGVEWCRRKISRRFPQFRFQHVDVYNKHYNPRGAIRPAEFRFPYDDESFDLAVLGSVFTHMLPPELERYLAEIARVLRRGGRCMITFFLLNEESRALIEEKKGAFDFQYGEGVYRTISQEVPEKAIAYDESYILDLYGKCGLAVRRPVSRGSWCGRGEHLGFQDIVIADRKQAD